MQFTMINGGAREQPQAECAGVVPGDHLRQGRLDVVIADDDIVTGLRIERDARVPQVGVYHARLVLLVVVYPQLHRWLLHTD